MNHQGNITIARGGQGKAGNSVCCLVSGISLDDTYGAAKRVKGCQSVSRLNRNVLLLSKRVAVKAGFF